MVPVGYVETAEFANLGFLTKSLYFSAWVKIILAKYVSAWLLAEGAVILSGLAYNGRWEDGSVKWNGGIYNIHRDLSPKFETGLNIMIGIV